MPFAVGRWIGGAYWFTSLDQLRQPRRHRSPARCRDTFAGIEPVLGARCSSSCSSSAPPSPTSLIRFLYPIRRDRTRPRPRSTTMPDHREPVHRPSSARCCASPPPRSARSSRAPSATETIELFLATSYDQFAERRNRHQLPAPAGRALRPPAPPRPRQGRGQGDRRTPRSCCSSACTTPAAPRWPSAGSTTSPATGPSPGPAAASPAPRSTRPPSRPWPRSASTSPASTPSPGPKRSSRPPTSSSPWAAATPARIFPGKRYEDWDLDDPAGQDVDAVRPIRDEIRQRVEPSSPRSASPPSPDGPPSPPM